jgi:hypothetical protein
MTVDEVLINICCSNDSTTNTSFVVFTSMFLLFASKISVQLTFIFSTFFSVLHLLCLVIIFEDEYYFLINNQFYASDFILVE